MHTKINPLVGRPVALKQSSRQPRYSVCTIFTRPGEYEAMLDSFCSHGFTPDDTEFLHVDNSCENTADAFQAYNAFLSQACGSYIILCHQDVLLLEDGRLRMDKIIAELDRLDSCWGLFGNAGAKPDHSFAIRITDPHGSSRTSGGPFPARVMTLDENFIVVRRSAKLFVSHDLAGFHMYGPDLCICADLVGFNAYVVDFHLHHKSGGFKDETFRQSKRAFRRKYRRALRSSWLSILGQVARYLLQV